MSTLGAGRLSGAVLSGAVFLSPQQAHEVLVRERPAVLDARGGQAQAPYLPGARTIDWRSYRDGWLLVGRLTDNMDRLQRAFEERGVDADRPVLVYGAMGQGWGEEGRIWWMLTYLGHREVRILDGGIGGWEREGLPVASQPARSSAAGRFEPRIRTAVRASAGDIADAGDDVVLLDVRTREEYAGAARPYFSARRGHIPGAVHFHWQDFIAPQGALKPADEIRASLAAVGVTPADDVVVYCTGGVRSSFSQAVLMQVGYPRVRNYDASWWEWSSDRSLPAEPSRPSARPRPWPGAHRRRRVIGRQPGPGGLTLHSGSRPPSSTDGGDGALHASIAADADEEGE